MHIGQIFKGRGISTASMFYYEKHGTRAISSSIPFESLAIRH